MAIENTQAIFVPGAILATRGECVEVFEQEFDYLCRTLRRLGTPGSDLEDTVHEVFLVLYARWNHYDPARPLRPWLFGIARRVVARQRRRWGREIPIANLDGRSNDLAAEETAAAHEARALVLAALQSVPIKRRAVLIMHDIDSIGIREAAARLSIPVFTAYSRLRKARKELAAAVRGIQKTREALR